MSQPSCFPGVGKPQAPKCSGWSFSRAWCLLHGNCQLPVIGVCHHRLLLINSNWQFISIQGKSGKRGFKLRERILRKLFEAFWSPDLLQRPPRSLIWAVSSWFCTSPAVVQACKKEVVPKTYSCRHNVFARLRVCFVLFC